mmetsp:Transcript_15335/g.64672  ORF Transcript_15335/g.64672 Transcript_15335/m.64672 type:complete len:271 (-) Transcript_15335:21-833(-)
MHTRGSASRASPRDFASRRRRLLSTLAASSSYPSLSPPHLRTRVLTLATVLSWLIIAQNYPSTVFCANRRTRRLYPLVSSVKSCAASGFAGDAGLGSVNKLCIEVSKVHTLWMGDHWSWMMSMHKVPSEYTFGWNTSLVKRTRGGFSGYCSPNVMRRENTPPSQAVSSGPKMVALHTNRLSSLWGLALHPSGGSVLIALRSDWSLSTAAVCWCAAPAMVQRVSRPNRAFNDSVDAWIARGFRHEGKRLDDRNRRSRVDSCARVRVLALAE